MSQDRIYISITLVLILLLSSLIPTATAAGLGLARQQQGANQHQLQASPFYDPSRSNVESSLDVDESTIKIRTREALQPPVPQQALGGPPVNPYQYSVPQMNPPPQQPAYVPVYYPNYNYYPVYGGSWGYPETRLVGNYGPYNSRRHNQQNRQKNGNRRRKERQKSGYCPKICDNCIKMNEIDQGKVNDELQKRFADHVKQHVPNKESVEALFKYMDGNDDGSISLTELQNYLLLRNIIPFEVPK